jgi:hypothetical protein
VQPQPDALAERERALCALRKQTGSLLAGHHMRQSVQ